jgi:hypothetical protein
MRKATIASLAAAAVIAVGCGASPADEATTPAPRQVIQEASVKPTTKPTPTPQRYANCAAMRKAHPNGVPTGHPAYKDSFDRDDDGRACETN